MWNLVRLVLILLLTFLTNDAKCDDGSVPNTDTTTIGSNSNNFSFKKDSSLSNYDNYDDYLADVSISSVELYNDVNTIYPTDRLHDCGLRDKCRDDLLSKQTPTAVNQLLSGESCRCDVENCREYGDCCWSLMENVTLSERKSLWHCNRLEAQNSTTIWSFMISECPETSQDEISKNLCSGQNIAPSNYTYLVDLPVYGNKSGKGVLYKNIYCARCHDERNSNILQWTMQLACNREFTPEERSEFMSFARYIPGERMWQNVDNTSKCVLKIAELRDFEIEHFIPNVRYCSARAADTCSPSIISDRNRQKNIDKMIRLCASYSQYVMNQDTGTIYKNPHCAFCIENTKSPILLSCRRPGVLNIFFKVRPGETGAILPGAGLNFLFDFGLSNNKYVGYEMLCGDDEIWDYIRQKCGPMICRQGYHLKNGVCVQIKEPLVGVIGNENGDGGRGDDVGESNNSSTGTGVNGTDPDPACYLIILHQHEYELLSNPNNSISIKLPDEEKPIILSASEYEYINETTVSTCAKYLHHAFKQTFPTSLNYLSLISVGLSVIFSSFHIILYLLLPKLRNPPGRNLFCLTLSLFIFQLLFLALFTHGKGSWLCTGAAITMHYFSLAAFFWMNIMSFDMWRTFSCNTLLRRSHSTDGQKFLKYSLFGWGAPLVIVGIAVFLDFGIPAPGYDQRDQILSSVRPVYGENGLCWITQRMSLFVFFAIPVAFVVTSNIILFSFTAYAILSQQKESRRVFKNKKSPAQKGNGKSPAKASPSKGTYATNRDKIRLMLYVNMALIMGLGWILGFISQFLASDWLRFPFVIVNGLQGTFIFFAFDFKLKIWQMLKDELYDSRLGKLLVLETSSSGVDVGNRRVTISMSSGTNTKSSNLVSLSDDERNRKISLVPLH